MENYDHLCLDKGASLTEQEKLILEKIEEGEIVDLAIEYGPDPRSRYVRSRFLEKLLTDCFDNYKAPRWGVRIRSAIIPELFDLELAQISHFLMLSDCTFESEINFKDANFKNGLELRHSIFLKKVNFTRLKVLISLDCRKTIFRGSVNFNAASIGRQFTASDSRFENIEERANFQLMKTGGGAFFRNTVFKGQVDFNGAEIGRQFSLSGAKFESNKHLADFYCVRVGGSAFFKKTFFKGEVDFRWMIIGEQFNANGARFEAKDKLINLFGIKVGESGLFRNVLFEGGVSIVNAQFLDLFIEGKDDSKINLSTLKLEHSSVERNLQIKHATIVTLEAMNLKVNGLVTIESVYFKEFIDLRYSNFQLFDMLDITLPGKNDSILIDGWVYRGINAGDKYEDWKKILTMINHARYHAQPYRQLEDYFNQTGFKERADQVFIAGRRRELRGRKGYNPSKWVTLIFWDWLAGYGRKPGRAFIASLVVIILGAIVFDPATILKPELLKNAEGFWKATEISQSWLPRLVLSINQFLPAVDFGLAKEINLTMISFWKLLYLQFHKLCGWILIPIGLAALTTRLK